MRLIEVRQPREHDVIGRRFTIAGFGTGFEATVLWRVLDDDGTPLAEGKEVREIDGRHHILEHPLRADFSLTKAHVADAAGNLVYRKTARNFGPVMAAAADTSIVQVTDVVARGALDPEVVVTPGIYVDTVVRIASPAPTDPREEL